MLSLLAAACAPPGAPVRAAPSWDPTPPPPLDVECPARAVVLEGETFDDLQDALDLADEGEVVAVCQGRHVGPFVATVPLTIGGVDRAVLDGDGAGPALTVPPGTRLLDLELTGGAAEAGGGLYLSSPGELLVARSEIYENHAEEGGGVWLGPGSTGWFPASHVHGNVARDGGGLWADHATVVEGTFRFNEATRYGGGAALIEADLAGAELSWNYGIYGGGAYVLHGTLCDALVEQNRAFVGDGVYALAGVALDDVRIQDHDGVGLDVGIDRVEIVGGAVHRNGVGAASSGGLGQVLVSESTDWGSGGADNAWDVAWAHDLFDFGPRATFTCAGEGCAPGL